MTTRLVIESFFANLKEQMRLEPYLANTPRGLAQRSCNASSRTTAATAALISTIGPGAIAVSSRSGRKERIPHKVPFYAARDSSAVTGCWESSPTEGAALS